MELNESTNKLLKELLMPEKGNQSEEELVRRLEKKLAAAESAGDYKAQADYWKEQYQALRKQCFRAISGKNGLKRLSEILEEDVYTLTN